MRTALSMTLLAAFAAVSLGTPRAASARWIPLSGPNYSQVYVAQSNTSLFGGQGLMCAVHVGNSSDFGAPLDCYAPSGPTESMLVAVAANGNGIFSATDPRFRIESVALQPADNGFRIHVLRSDKVVISSFLAVPLVGHIVSLDSWFYDISPTSPIVVRQIGWASGVGLVAVGTDNFAYKAVNGAWTRLLSRSGASVPAVQVNSTNGAANFLLGASALSSTFSALPPAWVFGPPAATQPLPFAQSNPDLAFSYFGRTTPMSCDPHSDCYVVYGGSPPSPTGTFSASISRAVFSHGSFGPWQFYPTDPEPTFSERGGPWSIQSASDYRGRAGEIFVIAGGARLLDWVP